MALPPELFWLTDRSTTADTTKTHLMEWHLHNLMGGFLSASVVIGITLAYSYLIMWMAFKGLHRLEIVDSKLLWGHDTLLSITQFSKLICIMLPALVYSLSSQGIEDCSYDHYSSQLVAVCGISQVNRPDGAGVPDDNIVLANINHLTTIGNLGVVLLASIVAWFSSGFRSFLYWLRKKFVPLWVDLEVPTDSVEDELQSLQNFSELDELKRSGFSDLENRYFKIDQSRRESKLTSEYEGPKDEYFSRGDAISSWKAESEQLEEYRESAKRAKTGHQRLKQALEHPQNDLDLDSVAPKMSSLHSKSRLGSFIHFNFPEEPDDN